MALNVKLLRKVKRHILKKPQRLVMSEGIVLGAAGEEKTVSDEYGEPTTAKIPECGAVGCIYGWTCMLGNPSIVKNGNAEYWNRVRVKAEKLLGITDFHASISLSKVDAWPEEIGTRYYQAKTAENRAKLVGERIDQFIAEHK